MTEKVICEKCGSEMQPIDPNAAVGMTCPNCGWGWATTYTEPIVEDTTEYRVILLDNNELSNDGLKTISRITNTNVVNAKKLFLDSPVCIFSGTAVEVRDVIETMDNVSLKYKTEPEFPY